MPIDTAKRESQRQYLERLEAKNRELTRTLQIIEEARANLADQYDFAPIGFVTFDAMGCVREINLTAARMLGRERASLLMMPFLSHVAKTHRKEFLSHLSECRNRHAEVINEMAVGTGQNQTLHVELRSVPVIDTQRGGTVYRTAMTDIAERQRAGKALRESEERYRDLVELSPDGVFIERDGLIAFANHAALRLCGTEKLGELLGCEMAELVRPVFRASVELLLEQASTTHEAPSVEVEVAHHNGTIVPVELAARTFYYEGEPSTLVVAHDISRRRLAERNALIISEREKERFGRDLHDSLLQNMVGASWRAEALRNQLRNVNPIAASEAEEIASIVRACMDEARTLARGLCPVTMETSGLIAALHELTVDITSHTNTECTFKCDESTIIGDAGVATNIYRIAQEAITNAIKHGKARTILIQLEVQNGKATLQVRNDGKGFPTKPNQMGMGLHTMRYRASMIGGSLDVRRNGASGTLVTCSFPVNREKL